MLELYHHGSSVCAAKVRFALEEKGLPWTGRVIDIFRGKQFNPQFLTLNPKAVVPVLVHNGFVIPESTVICEYIEEMFPEAPIYPDSVRGRAQVRLWTKAVDEELHPACSALTYIVSHRHTILRNGTGSFAEFIESGGAEGAAARLSKWEWIQHGVEAPGAQEEIRLYDAYLYKMERSLGNSQWLVENRFSMADIAMTPYVNRLAALSLEGLWKNGRLPGVEAWFERILDRPTFQPSFIEWMPSELAAEMRENGKQSWPSLRRLLDIR